MYDQLFEPLDRGRLQLRNRIVFPGHQTMFSEDGIVGERLREYYAARARGGAGAVVTEISAVHPTTLKFPRILRAYDEAIIPSYNDLASAIHEHDSRLIVQLAHSGSRMDTQDSETPLWGPSGVKSASSVEPPHAMGRAEIDELLNAYAGCCSIAARSDVDGVEVHAAHEYLLGEFLSPFNNRRTDEYGGDLENRARLLLLVLERAREALGNTKVLGLRLNGSDLTEDGLQPEDAVRVAQLAEATGVLDYVSVSAGTSRDNYMIVPPMDQPAMPYVHLASAIRSAIDLPVFAVGRIKHPSDAASVIADGHADAVAMARALIADPEWGNLARKDPARIRPCIGCNQGCQGFLQKVRPITCAVNPDVGKEAAVLHTRRMTPRHVVVVGGGPGGLEAAREAATLGHSVVLYEATRRLGGQSVAACALASRREIGDLVEWYRRELGRLDVDVRCNTLADHESLTELGATDVIIATGARPRALEIPATERAPRVVTPVDVMLRSAGHEATRAVVIDEIGHFQAYGPAEMLIDAGVNEVVVVTSQWFPGVWLDTTTRHSMVLRLRGKGVRFMTTSAVVALTDSGVDIRDVFTGEVSGLASEVVVAAIGAEPETTLWDTLGTGGFDSVTGVGDCVAPRTLLEAVREGRAAARAL